MCTCVTQMDGIVKALVAESNDQASKLSNASYAIWLMTDNVAKQEATRLLHLQELKEMREYLEVSPNAGPGTGKGQGLTMKRKVEELEGEGSERISRSRTFANTFVWGGTVPGLS